MATWTCTSKTFGSHGRVCVVNVQVGQKEFTHSVVHKLVPLECYGRIDKWEEMLRRKYELKRKHIYKFCDKQVKDCCKKQLKKQL